jgi:hypothetical protein
LTSVDRPKPASLVGFTPGGGWRFEGRSGQPWKIERALGSAFAPADPTIPKRPASGAGMFPKLSHGDELCCAKCIERQFSETGPLKARNFSPRDLF